MSADAQPEQAPPSLELSKLVATATPALKRMAPRLMGAALRRRYREYDLVQSALVEAIGGRIVVVEGEVDNRKITHPDDLVWARGRIESGVDLGGTS